MNNPKTPSGWIFERCNDLASQGGGVTQPFTFVPLATLEFLNALHAEGKLEMPDLPSNN